MTITRDQLRAARMLLHLRQDALAALAEVSLPTIRRFETGSDIRPLQLKKIRDAVTAAGAILVDGPVSPDAKGYEFGVGVVLRSVDDLPEETSARIAAERAAEAERIAFEKRRLKEEQALGLTPKPLGRRRKLG